MHYLKLVVLLAIIAVYTGCSIAPGELELTERDREVYVDEGGALEKTEETQSRVAIIIPTGNNASEKEIYSALDSMLTSMISDFAFFTIVERSNLAALQTEEMLSNLNSDGMGSINIPEADYVMTARIASATMAPKMVPPDHYQAVTNVDFRFYEKLTDRCVMTQNIESKAPGYTKQQQGPEAQAKLVEAVQESAKQFAIDLGARYAPEARVLETRGGGQVAKITMGSDYGLVNKAKVEFYEYVDNSDIVAGATRDPSPVGYGLVIEVAQKTAWIQIQNWKKVAVKRGHYVKLAADQSKGLKDKVTTGFGETMKGTL